MLPPNRKFILIVGITLAILLLCPALQANTTITISGGYSPYSGFSGTGSIGPYTGTVQTNGTGTPIYSGLVFCLDENLAYSLTYSDGTTASTQGTWTSLSTLITNHQDATLTQEEEEAAFLASYALYLGAHATGDSSTIQSTVDGPIAMAIWQIMNTLSAYTNTWTGVTRPAVGTDPAAQLYVKEA